MPVGPVTATGNGEHRTGLGRTSRLAKHGSEPTALAPLISYGAATGCPATSLGVAAPALIGIRRARVARSAITSGGATRSGAWQQPGRHLVLVAHSRPGDCDAEIPA